MDNKKCACCKQYKPLEQFNKDKYRVDGLTTYCKQCSRMKQKEYRNNMTKEQRNKRNAYRRILHSSKNGLSKGELDLLKKVFHYGE